MKLKGRAIDIIGNGNMDFGVLERKCMTKR